MSCLLAGTFIKDHSGFCINAGANFENAIITDVLFDRAVIVDANLRGADFSRTVSACIWHLSSLACDKLCQFLCM